MSYISHRHSCVSDTQTSPPWKGKTTRRTENCWKGQMSCSETSVVKTPFFWQWNIWRPGVDTERKNILKYYCMRTRYNLLSQFDDSFFWLVDSDTLGKKSQECHLSKETKPMSVLQIFKEQLPIYFGYGLESRFRIILHTFPGMAQEEVAYGNKSCIKASSMSLNAEQKTAMSPRCTRGFLPLRNGSRPRFLIHIQFQYNYRESSVIHHLNEGSNLPWEKLGGKNWYVIGQKIGVPWARSPLFLPMLIFEWLGNDLGSVHLSLLLWLITRI